MNLGNIHKERGDIEEAITCYRRALAINPSLAEAYMNLGSLAMEQKHLDGAILYYRQALKLNPCSAETCYNLANAYKDKGRIEPSEIATKLKISEESALFFIGKMAREKKIKITGVKL